MFTAALFLVAMTWEIPKHPSTDEWIKKWYIYTMEYYLAIKEWNNTICSSMDGPRDYPTKKVRKWKTSYHQFSSVQSLSRVWLFATTWTAACQASLSITNSRSLLKLLSIESVMSSNHLVLRCAFLLLPSTFPSIRVFFQWVRSLHQVAKVLGVSSSASVLPMNIQDWFPLGLTGWISL